MQWKNTPQHWGAGARYLHWLTVLLVATLLGLGLWIDNLTYYDDWYRTAPMLHKSIGIGLFLVWLLRLGWRLTNPPPTALTGNRWENRLAHFAHWLMYALIGAICVAGYMISTANGRPIMVFDAIPVPALFPGFEHQEDIAGEVHEILVWTLVGVVLLHAGAALKHHFVDHDATLRRMMVGDKTDNDPL